MKKVEISLNIKTKKLKIKNSWNHSLIKKTVVNQSQTVTVRWVKSVMMNAETVEDFSQVFTRRHHNEPVRQPTDPTPAAFATRISKLNPFWLATWRHTQERSLTVAVFVEKASSSAPICGLTWTLTPDRNPTRVVSVAEGSRKSGTWTRTYESTRGRNHTAVVTVGKTLERKQILSSTQ